MAKCTALNWAAHRQRIGSRRRDGYYRGKPEISDALIVAKSKTNKSKRSAKPAKASKRGSKNGGNSKPAELKVERSVVPEEPGPRITGEMSSVEIGNVAGEVWSILSQHGELTISTLKKEVPAPADMVLAAIGWLAREDKLEFTIAGKSIKVSLR
jgi:hypothetical protein